MQPFPSKSPLNEAKLVKYGFYIRTQNKKKTLIFLHLKFDVTSQPQAPSAKLEFNQKNNFFITKGIQI